VGHAKELILGDSADSRNMFRWERVRLNLPGALGYDPIMSWMSKVRNDGRVAADLFMYMDDLRPTTWAGRAEIKLKHFRWVLYKLAWTLLGFVGFQKIKKSLATESGVLCLMDVFGTGECDLHQSPERELVPGLFVFPQNPLIGQMSGVWLLGGCFPLVAH
jgi:hypothetical protein